MLMRDAGRRRILDRGGDDREDSGAVPAACWNASGRSSTSSEIDGR